jgi:hypothetical protein
LPIDKPITPAPIIVKSKIIILPKLNWFFSNQVYI